MGRDGRRILKYMEQDLKVLMIGSDRKLFENGSAVSERMKEYGNLVGELHIILMCNASHGLKDKQLSDNVWVYPTNSFTSILRPIDAARIGKKLVFEKKFVRGRSLITCQDLESGWAGVRIKKKWRIPMELQFHTDINSPYFTGFQNRVRKFFANKVLRNADSIRVVSESVTQKLKIENSKLKILPIYVDKEKIANAPIRFDVHARYPWHFIILMVCRLEPEKNIGLALEALALVRQKYGDTGLLVVGSGSLENSLRGKTGVELAGWQSDLASFYKTSNVFLQTSLYEGYGLALVEAGLSGLPVLSTPVGIVKELEDGKDLYICSSAEQFALRIIELIENNSKRENLRVNMKKTLEDKLISKEEYLNRLKTNWESTAKKVP